MSESNPVQNLAEKQKTLEAIPAVVLEWSVGPLLNAQADLLAGAEATVTDWLHRRHEAIVDTQQLIARVQTGADPVAAFKAQQEWISRSFRRLVADADACRSATQQLMERAPSWFPRGGWMWFGNGSGNGEAAASQAAATRAAARPLRMANSKPE
ncbi:MAG: hypothetical protein ABSE20_22800 [Acetobacteraceae bacterium]|jgi:hypothetical protein